MPESFVALRRTSQPAGAARYHFAGFAHRVALADRTDIGKNERRASLCRARHDAQHLRNDIARPLDPDAVPQPHIEPGNFIGVVQRRIGDDDPAYRDWRQSCYRSQCAGAPDLDIDR